MRKKSGESGCRRLTELSVGDTGMIESLECRGALRQKLLDMGFVRGAKVEKTGESPSGDPCAYLVRGAVVAIRSCDGDDILLRRTAGEGEEPWD